LRISIPTECDLARAANTALVKSQSDRGHAPLRPGGRGTITAMNVVPLPPTGRWAEDQRGAGRAVRVSAHAEARLLTVSLWKNEVCVGSVQLLPIGVAGLITGLTESLVQLTGPAPAHGPEAPRPADRRGQLINPT
jgi:hypothetical protein